MYLKDDKKEGGKGRGKRGGGGNRQGIKVDCKCPSRAAKVFLPLIKAKQTVVYTLTQYARRLLIASHTEKVGQSTGRVVTTFHFLCNLQMDKLTYSVILH